MVDVKTRLRVVIVAQCIHVLKYYAMHLKLIQCYKSVISQFFFLKQGHNKIKSTNEKKNHWILEDEIHLQEADLKLFPSPSKKESISGEWIKT